MSLSVIEGLAPSLLWNRFYEISQIPRASKSEDRIRLYLRNFAEKNNLEFKEDKVGNIVMKVEATPGFENTPTVVLQGHVDMVCEKNKGTEHDFANDPLKLINDGEWIKADGTTLGADNGIGVAAALAVINDNEFIHGPLELLFTIDEETGLTGANNLQRGFINGTILLNLDTEEDGAFYVGCAGGVDTAGIFKIEYQEANKKLAPYSIFISGLKGGHSGINISEGRANAIKLIAFLLARLKNYDYQLAFIQGGSKRNAIAREAEAVILIDPSNESSMREIINGFAIETSLEFKEADPEIKVIFEKCESPEKKYTKAFENDFTVKIINTLIALPHGVGAMSGAIKELVETSTNLATVTMDDKEIIIGTSQRSSIESAKRNIAHSVKAVFDLANCKVKSSDGYPGWQPNMSSEVLKLSRNVYKRLYSKEPLIKAVHAGLECGILGDKYPGLDMISLGPTIDGAHSPDERVNINDVEKFYDLLKAILAEIATQK